MRNPLPRPVEQAIAAGLLFAALWLWWSSLLARAKESALADAQLRAATARAAAWQSFYAAAASHVDTVRDTVERLVPGLIADTVWQRDTVLVGGEQRLAIPLPTAAKMQAALRSCGALASSVVPLRTACDSLHAADTALVAAWHAKYDAVRPRWYDRIGVTAGYGVMQDGTTVRAGPVLAVSVKVWP